MGLLEDFPLRLIVNGEDMSVDLGDGFTFSSTDPGGFESASFPIPRDLPAVRRGDPVRLECGLATAWEGRVKEIQRSLGEKTLIQCEGYRAVLKENSLAEVFVDRDLTKWVGPDLDRQIALAGSSRIKLNGSELTTTQDPTHEPAIVQSFEGPWEASATPKVETYYYSPGVIIDAIYYAWQRNGNLNTAEAAWEWYAEVGGVSSGDLAGVGPGAAYVIANTGASAVKALLDFQYNTGKTGTGAAVPYSIYWTKLAAYGKGYRKKTGQYRAAPDPVGIDPHWIAAHVIVNAGLDLGGMQFDGDEVPESLFTVLHAAYPTPVPVEQIVNDMAKFVGWHWGVWESRSPLTNSSARLIYRASPENGEPTAWAWRRECDQLDVRENIENLYDSAKVAYIEPGGVERFVEVSKTNPTLSAVGLNRQATLSLGQGTKASAEAWGLIQLDLLADQARITGTASIKEAVHEMNGAPKAPWMLKAGLDRLRVPDLPTSSAFGEHNDLPISRVECSGGADGLTTSVEFGKGVNLMETLAAQMQANLTANVR